MKDSLNLQEILRVNDLTQAQLARGIGIRKQHMNQWVSGKLNPSKSNTEKIVDFLIKHNFHIIYY